MKKNPELFVFYEGQVGHKPLALEIGCWANTAGMPLNEDAHQPKAALDEAADWMLRLQEANDDSRVLKDFETWLSRSDENRNAWQQVGKTWSLLGGVAPIYRHVWSTQPLQNSRNAASRQLRPKDRHRRWVIGLSAVGIAACLLVLAVPSLVLRFEADYLTEKAQSRVVTLDDGTTVYLGAESAIKSNFSASRRQVTLLAGEAFFDVSRNPDRPFVVDAKGVKVEVLGTAFDVRLSSAATSIELARGAVGVSYDAASRQSATNLSPGQMLVVDRDSGSMIKSVIASEDIAAWRDGRLFVNGATIGAVVEQIQRYHTAWIAIPDSTLASQTVTGLYDLHDPDRALRALVQPHGGRVRELSGFARILSRF